MITPYADLLRQLRVERGFSQSDMAEKLGLSRTSYTAIEQGKREITLSECEKLSLALGISINDIERGETADYEKYEEMILQFLHFNSYLTKTKLAKLLYFADFAWFYHNLNSMSGMEYRKIQYGPVADAYFRLIDEMNDVGMIAIECLPEGAMHISQTKAGAKHHITRISKDETALMKKINEKWKGKRTSEIVTYTHKQLPYMFADDNEIVSYELFGQENPDEIY